MSKPGFTDIPLPTQEGEHHITLEENERMVNPLSTKHFLYGPCTVHLYVWPDGGIDIGLEPNNPPEE